MQRNRDNDTTGFSQDPNLATDTWDNGGSAAGGRGGGDNLSNPGSNQMNQQGGLGGGGENRFGNNNAYDTGFPARGQAPTNPRTARRRSNTDTDSSMQGAVARGETDPDAPCQQPNDDYNTGSSGGGQGLMGTFESQAGQPGANTGSSNQGMSIIHLTTPLNLTVRPAPWVRAGGYSMTTPRAG
ncbi:hypothetical protein BN946_scf184911.g80 [Trametes cinnabarina]|uniref:Uncharacterized protein n=1 Tax=Pycnoporus cinnabarinus TaxID=5643 RepID=A0A060SB80_PYCCI|nr:hypothetical protein BN946_scf184911.g80 [Trametes cinnabarina]